MWRDVYTKQSKKYTFYIINLHENDKSGLEWNLHSLWKYVEKDRLQSQDWSVLHGSHCVRVTEVLDWSSSTAQPCVVLFIHDLNQVRAFAFSSSVQIAYNLLLLLENRITELYSKVFVELYIYVWFDLDLHFLKQLQSSN